MSLKVNILIGLVVFVFLQLIALWILCFVYHVPIEAVQLKSSIFEAKNGDTIKERPVSFASDGSLRVGAGTTAYLDAATLPAETMHYIQLGPIGTTQTTYSTAILSYYLPDKAQTAVTTLTVAKDKSISIAEVKSANVISNQIRGVATLSDTQAVFLEQTSAGAVFATPGKIASNSIEVQSSLRTQIGTGSVSNAIGAISSTQFAITSFEPYNATGPWGQRVTVGTLAADGSISLTGTPLSFGDTNFYDSVTFASQSVTFGKPQAVSGLPSTFLQPWWSNKAVGNSGFCILVGSVSNSAVTKAGETCTTKYKPTNFLDSTALSATTVLYAFYDSNNNNAFTLLVVEASATKVFFRGAYAMESNAAGNFNFGTFYSWYPTPSVKLVSPTRIAVAFLNANNQGSPYTQIFSLSESVVKPVTPLMRLANSDFTLAGTSGTSGSVTLGMIPVSSESIVVGFCGKLGSVSPKRISLVEFYGPLAGVGTGTSGIVVNGVARVSGSLTTGTEYFTNTRGDVVTVTAGDPSADYYAIGTTMIVSADSRLGYAVDSSSIHVKSRN